MAESSDLLGSLPGGARKAVQASLPSGEKVVACWTTRGPGANALVATESRALLVKKAPEAFTSWSTASFAYRDLQIVRTTFGRFGNASEIHLATAGEQAPQPLVSLNPLKQFSVDLRRPTDPNVLVLRKRSDAEAVVRFLTERIEEAHA
jgi:hypothetical protein